MFDFHRRRGCSLILNLLVACCGLGTLSSQGTVWTETGTVIDTVVADTKTIAPAPASLTRLATPVPFKSFRYCQVDEGENVTFIADDPLYTHKATSHGIFRSSARDGGLRCLVAQDEPMPGTRVQLALLRGMHSDEHGADFVFNATNDAMSHDQQGVFVWSEDKLTTVAQAGFTLLPGETSPLRYVAWGALHSGRVLYMGATPQQQVLVLHDLATGSDRVLLRTGDPIPGHPGETFGYVATQNWLDGSSVVFRASTADPHASKGQKIRSGLYGWFNVRWDDPGTLDLSRLVTIADSDGALPLLGEQQFSDFRSAPVEDGLVAFTATGKKDHGFYVSRVGESPRAVVDTRTELPGLFKGPFRSFEQWPATVQGSAVFIGKADGFVGVFLYRVDQDALYLLADTRAPLDDKQIEEFAIGNHPMVGNRVALTVTFADQTSGVYLATVPAHAFKRMDGTTKP